MFQILSFKYRMITFEKAGIIIHCLTQYYIFDLHSDTK